MSIHFLSPGVDPAFEVLHLLETRAGQDLDRTRGPRSAFAENDHFLGGVQFGHALGDFAERDVLRARLRATAITLEQAAEKRVSYEDAKAALCQGIAQTFNLQLSKGTLSPAELRTTQALCRDKYASLNWPPMRRTGQERDDAGMSE